MAELVQQQAAVETDREQQALGKTALKIGLEFRGEHEHNQPEAPMRPDWNTESFEKMSRGHDDRPLKSMGGLPELLESNAIHWPETHIRDFNSPMSTEVFIS